MKFAEFGNDPRMLLVAPVRERGLKCNHAVPRLKNLKVAPVRERGLKLLMLQNISLIHPSRSRKGAWIEIRTASRST